MVRIEVLGVDDFNDDHVYLLCSDQSTVHIVSFMILAKTIDEILDALPFKADITMKGIEITKFDFVFWNFFKEQPVFRGHFAFGWSRKKGVTVLDPFFPQKLSFSFM